MPSDPFSMVQIEGENAGLQLFALKDSLLHNYKESRYRVSNQPNFQ